MLLQRACGSSRGADGQPGTLCPLWSTASSHGPRDALPDRPRRAGTLWTRAAQLRLLLTSLKITGFLAAGQMQNATHFKAWTQVFGFFQRMLQKASASCTDGYSQDLEHNPRELVKVDFTPYEIIVSVILLNIKGYS